MYKIYIDTTVRFKKSVAIKKMNEVIDEVKGDIDILSEVKNLLRKNNIEIDEVEEMIPNVGPGSFTGIKMGVTAANIFNKAIGNGTQYKPNYESEPNIQKS